MIARTYCGRYSLRKGEPPVTVTLGTSDLKVARKRLRDIVIQAQREAEGIIAPAAQREAASTSLAALCAEYISDMRRRELTANHIRDTEARFRRLQRETGWERLADIRADGFLRWLGGICGSAKTRKEYQSTVNALLNWLVRSERIERNPLGKLDKVVVKGKQVRPARSFTVEELQRLFAVAGVRALAYRTLLYTAQRKNEVRQLVWGDLHLDSDRPYALFREGTTKDKDKRPVPLHPLLARELRDAKPENAEPSAVVFRTLPHHATLRADLERAGIEWRDGLGRVLHFHSFRKTWQTLGANCGLNQRAAQDILGHSDANLTANVYTDRPALALHDEVVKLPWIGSSQTDAQENVSPLVRSDFRQVLRDFVSLAQDVVERVKADYAHSLEVVVGPGFEPVEAEQVKALLVGHCRNLLRLCEQIDSQGAANSALSHRVTPGSEPASESDAKRGEEPGRGRSKSAGTSPSKRGLGHA